MQTEIQQKLVIDGALPLELAYTCHKLPTYVSNVTAFYDKGCPYNGISQNWGTLGPSPLVMGTWLILSNTPVAHTCYLSNLVVLGQTVRALLRR